MGFPLKTRRTSCCADRAILFEVSPIMLERVKASERRSEDEGKACQHYRKALTHLNHSVHGPLD